MQVEHVKRRILWFAMSGLMVLSLVVVACAPSGPSTPAAPTPAPAPAPAPALAPAPGPTSAPSAPDSDKPQYGGTRTVVLINDPTIFDSGEGNGGSALAGTVYEKYINSDWMRGPAGSGVTDFAAGANSLEDSYGPELAESFETPDGITWIFQIRQGVYWQQGDSDAGKLMAGREMTADDVVSSWDRLAKSPKAWANVSQPAVMKAATVEKTGPWEVTVKTPVDPVTAFSWVTGGAGFLVIYPPEVVAKYGNVSNWRNAVGTGPFILKDYVVGSVMTFKRNPNYWARNPAGPGKGDQLPYVDTYIQLIIPDLSTRQSALRVGKIDTMTGVSLDDFSMLVKSSPKLEYLETLSNQPYAIGMRRDRKDKPFSDIKVRQALMLATDFEAFKRDYFGGKAEIDIYPVNKQVTPFYQPLSEMPQSVQELFTYNPDKAKQLLKEAGYPNGFKASIVVSGSQQIDEVSIFKGQWAKVGIELVIDAKENSAFTTVSTARSHEDLIYRSMFQTFSIQLFLSGLRGTSTFNSSYVNDPPGSDSYIEDRYTAIQANIFTDPDKAYQSYKELKPYVLEQAFYIPRPTPYNYTVWWPWLKNYYGQGGGSFLKYNWIDQDLKKSMGY
jgi:peptide/nickel transport system substrate-binding protein